MASNDDYLAGLDWDSINRSSGLDAFPGSDDSMLFMNDFLKDGGYNGQIIVSPNLLLITESYL